MLIIKGLFVPGQTSGYPADSCPLSIIYCFFQARFLTGSAAVCCIPAARDLPGHRIGMVCRTRSGIMRCDPYLGPVSTGHLFLRAWWEKTDKFPYFLFIFPQDFLLVI